MPIDRTTTKGVPVGEPWGALAGAQMLASLRRGDELVLTGPALSVTLRVETDGSFPSARVMESTHDVFAGQLWQLMGTFFIVMDEHLHVLSTDWFEGYLGVARPHSGEASLWYKALSSASVQCTVINFTLRRVQVTGGAH